MTDARRQRAATLGGIEATAEERRAAAEMDDPGDGDDRGVGTHITASGDDRGSTDGSGGRGVGTAPVMATTCRSIGHLSTDPA